MQQREISSMDRHIEFPYAVHANSHMMIRILSQ